MAGTLKILFLLLFFVMIPYVYLKIVVIPEIDKGDASFLRAQQEEESSLRYLQYNLALQSYLIAEQRLPSLFKDWRLAMRTGQALYNLRQYPEAMYYFLIAYRDNPSKEIEAALKAVSSKLGLPYPPDAPISSPQGLVLADFPPWRAGTIVQLLEEDGLRVKVRTSQGALGYLPKGKLRALE